MLEPASATAGAYSLLRHTLEPGYVAMPLHRHPRFCETLFGVGGRRRVRVADVERTLGPGESLIIPAGAWHTVWNARPRDPHSYGGFGAGERATYLGIVAPGGLEAYHAAVAALLPSGDGPVPDVERVLAISQELGIEVQMQGLLDLVATHGVSLA